MSIDKTIEHLKDAFKAIGTEAVMTAIAAATGPVAPFVRLLLGITVKPFVGWVIGKFLDVSEVGAFMLNTAIQVDKQANEFEKAAKALEDLPPDATAEEKKKAEEDKILAAKKLIKWGA